MNRQPLTPQPAAEIPDPAPTVIIHKLGGRKVRHIVDQPHAVVSIATQDSRVGIFDYKISECDPWLLGPRLIELLGDSHRRSEFTSFPICGLHIDLPNRTVGIWTADTHPGLAAAWRSCGPAGHYNCGTTTPNIRCRQPTTSCYYPPSTWPPNGIPTGSGSTTSGTRSYPNTWPPRNGRTCTAATARTATTPGRHEWPSN